MKLKFNLSKIKEKFSKAILTVGQRAFLFILLFVLIDLVFGFFIFYEYVYLAQKKEGEVSENILRFNFEKYQKVLNRIQSIEKNNADLIFEEIQESENNEIIE